MKEHIINPVDLDYWGLFAERYRKFHDARIDSLELRFTPQTGCHHFRMCMLAQVGGGDTWEPVELIVEGLEHATLGFEKVVDYGYVNPGIGVVFEDGYVRLNLEHYSKEVGGPNELGEDSCSRYVIGTSLQITSPYDPKSTSPTSRGAPTGINSPISLQ